MTEKTILVVGGCGYIGSHTCIELVQDGYNVVCADNFNNSKQMVISRIEKITGRKLTFHVIDFCDRKAVEKLFAEDEFFAAIHFAGHKAVGESIEEPLMYYENNLLSVINLCLAMRRTRNRRIVFSSSATVYGTSQNLPLKETEPVATLTPYGRTKLFIEDILRDVHTSEEGWGISLLRYFNPVGAHPSGLIGEDPSGVPNNLMPYIAQVAGGRLEKLRIYGDDYDTPDGTGVRDFIHVVDLARGHVSALRMLEKGAGCFVHNLGTGQGHSVLELVHAFERVNGVKIPYEIVNRRPGDAAASYAAVDKAYNELDWKSEKTIEDMVRDTWNWQKNNPKGYDE